MALYNHLFARRNQGKWILRIEDTDRVVLSFSCVFQSMLLIFYILESLCSRIDGRYSESFRMGRARLRLWFARIANEVCIGQLMGMFRTGKERTT